MTSITRKQKTAFAKWLFENSVELREGAALFRCSHETLRRIAAGERAPKGETAELILAVLTGAKDLASLKREAEQNA